MARRLAPRPKGRMSQTALRGHELRTTGSAGSTQWLTARSNYAALFRFDIAPFLHLQLRLYRRDDLSWLYSIDIVA